MRVYKTRNDFMSCFRTIIPARSRMRLAIFCGAIMKLGVLILQFLPILFAALPAVARADAYSPLQRAGAVAMFGQPKNGYFFSYKTVVKTPYGLEPYAKTNAAGDEIIVWAPWRTVEANINGKTHVFIMYVGFDSYDLAPNGCPYGAFYGICQAGDVSDEADVRLVDFDTSNGQPKLVTTSNVLFRTDAVNIENDAKDIYARDMENGFVGLIFSDGFGTQGFDYTWDRILLISGGTISYAGAIPRADDVESSTPATSLTSTIKFIPSDYDSPDSIAVTFSGIESPPDRGSPIGPIHVTDIYSDVVGSHYLSANDVPGYSGPLPPGDWVILTGEGSPMPAEMNTTYDGDAIASLHAFGGKTAWDLPAEWVRSDQWDVRFTATQQNGGVCSVNAAALPHSDPPFAIGFTFDLGGPYKGRGQPTNDKTSDERFYLKYRGADEAIPDVIQLTIVSGKAYDFRIAKHEQLADGTEVVTANLDNGDDWTDTLLPEMQVGTTLQIKMGNKTFLEPLNGFATASKHFVDCYTSFSD